MSFREKMAELQKSKGSNIVLALDLPFASLENRLTLLSKSEKILDAVYPYLCALKVNHHLLLPLGTFDGVQMLVRKAHDHGLMTIMDCKINDIGNTNEVIAKYYYAAGFDAVIANPFIGWEEGLKPVFDVAFQQNRGVILLVYMSHKASIEGYGQTVINPENGESILQYLSFAKTALERGADGAVVGATYPEKIREIHRMLGSKVPIYSPGVGAQGGTARTAMEAGASYLIVGREIILSENPGETARKIRDSTKLGK